jgi:hypothetical protein
MNEWMKRIESNRKETRKKWNEENDNRNGNHLSVSTHKINGRICESERNHSGHQSLSLSRSPCVGVYSELYN